jgi:CelD/BcsL family acetyltransferase involved in cellulose biosynthesis
VEETPCSAIAIEQPFEKFMASRSKDLRRNLRRYKEKAEAIGGLKFDVAESADAELMDALVKLHGALVEGG